MPPSPSAAVYSGPPPRRPRAMREGLPFSVALSVVLCAVPAVVSLAYGFLSLLAGSLFTSIRSSSGSGGFGSGGFGSGGFGSVGVVFIGLGIFLVIVGGLGTYGVVLTAMGRRLGRQIVTGFLILALLLGLLSAIASARPLISLLLAPVLMAPGLIALFGLYTPSAKEVF